MTDPFAELLQTLNAEYSLSLHPDKRGHCKLRINDSLHIQIEYRQEAEQLLIASFLCELPPGRFRTEVFKTSLKANHLHPESPLLGYSDKNAQLTLFQLLPLTPSLGAKLPSLLSRFIEKGEQWRSAIQHNNLLSLIPSSSKPSQGAGMFGLKR